jgi:hypothetical protein
MSGWNYRWQPFLPLCQQTTEQDQSSPSALARAVRYRSSPEIKQAGARNIYPYFPKMNLKHTATELEYLHSFAQRTFNLVPADSPRVRRTALGFCSGGGGPNRRHSFSFSRPGPCFGTKSQTGSMFVMQHFILFLNPLRRTCPTVME